MQSSQILAGYNAGLGRLLKGFVGCHDFVDERTLNTIHFTPELHMTGNNEQEKICNRSLFILCTDIIAGIAVVFLLTVLWWERSHPIKVSFSVLSLQLITFFADLPFGVIGAIWLEYTHREFLRGRFPVYYRWHLRAIIFFFGLFLPLVLLKYGK